MNRNEFLDTFNRVHSDADLENFIVRHRFTTEGLNQNPRSQVYKVVGGLVDGAKVVITHRWYDSSGPFSSQPDVAKVELDIDGQRVATISWNET